MSVIKDLQSRGLIAQTTDIEALDALLNEQKISLYCGFDPTADSLHIGHLLPVLALRRFQQAGHTPIALVGGATGMIGDPSFKAAERSLNSAETVAGWVESIRNQLTPFLSFDGDNAAIMANNADWFGSMNCLDFLRDIGKHFSVNAMLNKESVKQRIERDDVGISFTEFAYSLLQGYDFAELNKRHGAVLEIGGSDQWGNITAGIDLTRRLHQKQVFGLTLPLVTKSDGTKFGKTEGGAVRVFELVALGGLHPRNILVHDESVGFAVARISRLHPSVPILASFGGDECLVLVVPGQLKALLAHIPSSVFVSLIVKQVVARTLSMSNPKILEDAVPGDHTRAVRRTRQPSGC